MPPRKNSNYYIKLSIILILFLSKNSFSAISTLLNDAFYKNPAAISSVKKTEFLIGGLILNPEFTYVGYNNLGQYGRAKSNLTDFMPYVLISQRINDDWVLGFNIVPSGYTDINWSTHSFIKNSSTSTKIYGYSYIPSLSYRVTKKLSVGAGLNISNRFKSELNFVPVGDSGNLINSNPSWDYGGSVGLFYSIDDKTFFSAAYYSHLLYNDKGISTLGAIVDNTYHVNGTNSPVAYVGLFRNVKPTWLVGGKIYWSGWSILKAFNFDHTAIGNFSVPTKWKDVWSFEALTRYGINDKFALLGDIMYETNPNRLETNVVAYPLSSFAIFSGGLDYQLSKALSSQVIYTYGFYTPSTRILNTNNQGRADLTFNALTLQMTYKA